MVYFRGSLKIALGRRVLMVKLHPMEVKSKRIRSLQGWLRLMKPNDRKGNNIKKSTAYRSTENTTFSTRKFTLRPLYFQQSTNLSKGR